MSSDATVGKAAEAFEFAFDRVQSEYGELSDSWKQLDSKAQATATIAGIFIAASFAFIRNSALQLTGLEKTLLLLVLASLIVSILLAVTAMLVRTVPVPPTPENIAEMVTDLLETLPEEHEERLGGLIADTINAWLPINRELRRELLVKAAKLENAQRALIAAACLMATLTATTVAIH